MTRIITIACVLAILAYIAGVFMLIVTGIIAVSECNDAGGRYEPKVPACYAPDGRRIHP